MLAFPRRGRSAAVTRHAVLPHAEFGGAGVPGASRTAPAASGGPSPTGKRVGFADRMQCSNGGHGQRLSPAPAIHGGSRCAGVLGEDDPAAYVEGRV